MLVKYVIHDLLEGYATFKIIAYSLDDAFKELCITAAENNCKDWEIEEEYEINEIEEYEIT